MSYQRVRGSVSMLKGLLATIKSHFDTKSLEHTHILVKDALDEVWNLEELVGSNELSESELRVRDLVVQGLPNQAIAERLMVTDKAIKFHLTNIYRKLGCKGRAGIIVEHYKDALRNSEEDRRVLQEKITELSGRNDRGRDKLSDHPKLGDVQ